MPKEFGGWSLSWVDPIASMTAALAVLAVVLVLLILVTLYPPWVPSA